MPDLTIETTGVCPQYYAVYEATGSKGETYRVFFDGDHGNRCECKAYQFFKGATYDRTCKHIKLIQEHGCFYHGQGIDPGPNDLESFGIKLVHEWKVNGTDSCPGCGHNMVVVRIGV